MVPSDADAQALVGTTIAGKFFVHELLGRGGMGDVYKATLLGPDRPIALKLVGAARVRADPSLARRFEREEEAVSRLRHPHAVEVVDFGTAADGGLYLAMEFVPGRTLAQVLADEAPLSPARAVHLTGQVLAALGAAHAAGIVHRDLKPANVMIDPLRDPAGFVKVVDFGIATLAADPAASERVTSSDVVFGTPAYMSPEQIRGEPLDARSDLYSAGVMLFEMLAGALPFEAATPMALAAKHLSERAPRLSERRPRLAVPRALEDAVARALEKNPARRPASAQELGAELDAAVATGVPRATLPAAPTLPPTVPLRAMAAPPPRRRWGRIAVGGGLGGAIAVAAAVLLLARSPRPTATATATASASATTTTTTTTTATATATTTATTTDDGDGDGDPDSERELRPPLPDPLPRLPPGAREDGGALLRHGPHLAELRPRPPRPQRPRSGSCAASSAPSPRLRPRAERASSSWSRRRGRRWSSAGPRSARLRARCGSLRGPTPSGRCTRSSAPETSAYRSAPVSASSGRPASSPDPRQRKRPRSRASSASRSFTRSNRLRRAASSTASPSARMTSATSLQESRRSTRRTSRLRSSGRSADRSRCISSGSAVPPGVRLSTSAAIREAIEVRSRSRRRRQPSSVTRIAAVHATR